MSRQGPIWPVVAGVSGSGIISGGGTVATGGYTLTVPATGTASLLGTAQTITAVKTHSATQIFSNMTRHGTVEFIAQDATPATRNDGTALVADDLWYETDTNVLWFWNGTYWLSAQLFKSSFSEAGLSGDSTRYAPVELSQANTYDLYVVDLMASTFVLTTNDGAQYWNFRVGKITAGNSLSAVGSSFTTAADSATTWTLHEVSINTFLDLTGDIKAMGLDFFKTTTPGNLYFGAAITYRLVHR